MTHRRRRGIAVMFAGGLSACAHGLHGTVVVPAGRPPPACSDASWAAQPAGDDEDIGSPPIRGLPGELVTGEACLDADRRLRCVTGELATAREVGEHLPSGSCGSWVGSRRAGMLRVHLVKSHRIVFLQSVPAAPRSSSRHWKLVAGDLLVQPPRAVVMALADAKVSAARVDTRVCRDHAGNVTEVGLVRGTGFPELDAFVLANASTLRFSPLMAEDVELGLCAPFAFTYELREGRHG